jgi:protein-tyrosine phosphatase
MIFGMTYGKSISLGDYKTLIYLLSFFIPIMYGYIKFKMIVFETLLMIHVIEHSLGTFNWFNEIEKDKLFLGAIPLKLHAEKFQNDIKITSVLSVVERFEIYSNTLAGETIRPEDWKTQEINHLWLESPDFQAPSLNLLNIGADFIYENINILKRNVYVHCKSGMGRSACMVLAYMIKYQRRPAKEAHKILLSKRSVIFGLNSHQYKRIEEFESFHNSNSKNKDMDAVIA